MRYYRLWYRRGFRNYGILKYSGPVYFYMEYNWEIFFKRYIIDISLRKKLLILECIFDFWYSCQGHFSKPYYLVCLPPRQQNFVSLSNVLWSELDSFFFEVVYSKTLMLFKRALILPACVQQKWTFCLLESWNLGNFEYWNFGTLESGE